FEDRQMPPSGKLPERIIADFENRIRQGAIDPREGPAATLAAKPLDIEAGKQFWAFRPPQAQTPLALRNPAWPRKKTDHFLLARLEQAGLAPSPPADRQTWIRRVSFDLIGLPPTPEQIESFVHDSSPDAAEKVVERLLASPQYG